MENLIINTLDMNKIQVICLVFLGLLAFSWAVDPIETGHEDSAEEMKEERVWKGVCLNEYARLNELISLFTGCW